MRYINPISRRGFVNRFADFIIKNIGNEHKSVIQVTDFNKFVVVNGFTESDKFVDFYELKQIFIKNNKTLIESLGLENFNVVDIIEYKKPVEYAVSQKPTNSKHFLLYNTIRPFYSTETIKEFNNPSIPLTEISSFTFTDKLDVEFKKETDVNIFSNNEFLSVSSEFPFGYNLKSGRSILYYSEYICNHIFDITNSTKLHFKFSDKLDSVSEDLDIFIDTFSNVKNEKIKSMILDVFDFNISKFEVEYLTNYDIDLDLSNPFLDKPWLIKDKSKDLILF